MSLEPPAPLQAPARAARARWAEGAGEGAFLAAIRQALEMARQPGPPVFLSCDPIGLERASWLKPSLLEEMRVATAEGRLLISSSPLTRAPSSFFGVESVLRRHAEGAHALLRLTGSLPSAFLASEELAFPQLPQALVLCGCQAVILPGEAGGASAWEGPDGSRVAVIRTMEAEKEGAPSLADLLESLPPLSPSPAPPAWHGSPPPFGLGWSDGLLEAEEARMLDWEAGVALLSLFRRSASEVESRIWAGREAWRALVSAQSQALAERKAAPHRPSRASSIQLFTSAYCHGQDVRNDLTELAGRPESETLLVNLSGSPHRLSERPSVLVPGFGWTSAPHSEEDEPLWKSVLGVWVASSHGWKAEVDFETGMISLSSPAWPEGLAIPLPRVQWGEDQTLYRTTGQPHSELDTYGREGEGEKTLEARWGPVTFRFTLDPRAGGLHLAVRVRPKRLDPGFASAIQSCWKAPEGTEGLLASTPGLAAPPLPGATASTLSPLGQESDSPLWREEVEGASTSQAFVAFHQKKTTLLLAHSLNPEWLAVEGEHRHILARREGDDPASPYPEGQASYLLSAHPRLTPSSCWSLGSRALRRRSGEEDGIMRLRSYQDPPSSGALAQEFSALALEAPGVVITSLRRDLAVSAEGLPRHAARVIPCPFVVRLIEMDGHPAEAKLKVAGQVVKAFKTNLLGEVEEELEVAASLPSLHDPVQLGGRQSLLSLPIRAHEIVTLYLDILEGRLERP